MHIPRGTWDGTVQENMMRKWKLANIICGFWCVCFLYLCGQLPERLSLKRNKLPFGSQRVFDQTPKNQLETSMWHQVPGYGSMIDDDDVRIWEG